MIIVQGSAVQSKGGRSVQCRVRGGSALEISYVLYSEVQVQCSAVQCSAVQCSAVQSGAV